MCGVYLCPCTLLSTQFVSRVSQSRSISTSNLSNLVATLHRLSQQTNNNKIGRKGSNKIKQTFKFLCLAFFVGFFLFFFFFQLRFEINPKNHIYSQNAGFRFVLYFFSVYKKSFFFIFLFCV